MKRARRAGLLLVACCAAFPALAVPALRCSVAAPPSVVAGQPVALHFTLRNPGPAPLAMLRWDTPFEGAWLAPFVTLSRDGRPLPYQGTVVRRRPPDAAAYLRIEAGGSVSAEIGLDAAFDVTVPGRYSVQSRLHLADLHLAHAGPLERPPEAHRAADLACPAVVFTVVPQPR
jgi:hypothetical protein